MIPIDGGTANMVVTFNKGVVAISHATTPYLIQDMLRGSDDLAILG